MQLIQKLRTTKLICLAENLSLKNEIYISFLFGGQVDRSGIVQWLERQIRD